MSSKILLGSAPLLSAGVAFVVGERLITGRFLQHGLSDYYWIYEIVFFVTLALVYGFIRPRLQGWSRRIFAGLVLAYLSSFLSYHLYILISRSPTGWFLALKDNLILTVFAPACLVGLIVGGIYVVTLEVLSELAGFAGKGHKQA